MFYLIIKKNKKEIISNQLGMEALSHLLDNDIENLKKIIMFNLEKETPIDSFREESLTIFKTKSVEINFINRKILELKDLTIYDDLINSLFCYYTSFLNLLDNWQKFKNDNWNQFVILFDGDKFTLIPIYNDKSIYVENIINKNKNKSYWICFVHTVANSTTAYPTSSNSSLNLISILFGEPTFYIHNLNEIEEFMKPNTDFAMGYEDISISCLRDNSIEISDNNEEFDRKIRLTKENFYAITKEWYDLYDEFEISQVWDLKKLKISYFNNTINFEYELDPERIKKLAKGNSQV